MRGQPRDPAVEALLQAIELEPDSGLLRSSLAEVQARRTKEEEQAARELYLLGTVSEPARNLLGTLPQAARELPPNAIDLGARVFASKSVLHAARPGGSAFNAAGAPPPPGGKVRALNTFAVTTEPADGGCVVRAINYAHLGGRFSTALMNWINCKAFVAPVYERLQQAMNERAARVLGKILKERVDPKSDAERAFPL